MSNGAPKSNRRLMTITFVLVCAGALVATAIAVVQTRRFEADARGAIDQIVARGTLVRRLEIEVEARRILIDDHIFAKDAAEMADLETQINDVDARIGADLRAFRSWGAAPRWGLTWERTLADLQALDAPIAHALALSRENRDVEARARMKDVGGRFAELRDDLEGLVGVTDQAASDGLAHLSSLKTRLEAMLTGIGVTTIVATLLLWRWTGRNVERREAEAALYARNLEARNRDLDAFAGHVAHDIRGALGTITLALTPRSRQVLGDDRTSEILLRGTRRMETLINDLLTLARVEAQGHGTCDPAIVLSDVTKALASRVEAAHAALRVSVTHAHVACSEGLLGQALTNLIDNAVKYRRPEAVPAVEISGAALDGGYELRVSDNGTGMTDDEAGHVLEPFYRAPRSQEVPGTGLGLSIVNRIAEANGGTVSVRSRLGVGSTFVLHLPLADDAAHEEGARDA